MSLLNIKKGFIEKIPCYRGIKQVSNKNCECDCECDIYKSLELDQDTGKGVVALHDGELSIIVKDLEIVGRGFNWKFERTYRSAMNYNGPIGKNWTFNYDRKLLLEHNGNATIFDGYGKSLTYYKKNGNYSSPMGFYSILIKNPDGSFIERDRYGAEILYSKLNKLGYLPMIELRDRNNNKMFFQYSKKGQLVTVRDTLGRTIVYHYNQEGGIKEVIDFTKRKILLEYDSNNFLISAKIVTVSDGIRTRRYEYRSDSGNAEDSLLVQVINPNEYPTNSEPYLQIEYTKDKKRPQTRVSKVVLGGKSPNGIKSGGGISYEYSDNNLDLSKNNSTFLTKVLDRNGNYSEYQFVGSIWLHIGKANLFN